MNSARNPERAGFFAVPTLGRLLLFIITCNCVLEAAESVCTPNVQQKSFKAEIGTDRNINGFKKLLICLHFSALDNK